MKSEPGDPRQWVAYADADLRVARLAIDAQPAIFHSACFHAQEAAEKFLKAFLVDKKQPLIRSHDLDLLVQLCTRIDPAFKEIADACEVLNALGPSVRYPPTGFDDPTADNAQEALHLAQRIAAFVRERLPSHT